VNGLEISNLQKSKNNDSLITVDIIANHLTEDSDGETILKEAFTDDVIKDFIDNGIIDYWHDSDNAELTKEAQNAAIIGKPIAFRWDHGKPVVTAQLTKTHPIVKEMLPHLQAAQPVYAASVAGSKMVLRATDAQGNKHDIIPKIKWNKLAIAPAPYVVNRGAGMNVRLLNKAQGIQQDIMCEFDNFNIFNQNISIFEKEEDLRKALLAPNSVSSLYNDAGGVTTKQDLEKQPVNLTLSEEDGLDLIDTIIGVHEKRIPLKKAEYMKHFESKNKKDFGHKSYGLINKYFKFKKERR